MLFCGLLSAAFCPAAQDPMKRGAACLGSLSEWFDELHGRERTTILKTRRVGASATESLAKHILSVTSEEYEALREGIREACSARQLSDRNGTIAVDALESFASVAPGYKFRAADLQWLSTTLARPLFR